MKKKRILMLTQWFEPEPTFKGLVLARELVRLGYEVEVVTGFPNYPGGKLYPGFRIEWLRREVVEGVEVTRVPLYPSHDTSVVGRLLNYASFAAAALRYCLFSARRPDAIYVFQLPTKAVVAAIVRWFRGVPFVYDVQDIWPDSLRATGMVREGLALRSVASVANWAYRHADRLVVNSDGFRDLLVARGVEPEKIEVVMNWCDETSLRFDPSNDPSPFPDDGRFRIVFAGNMGRAQALGAVLEAAALLRDEPRIKFVMVGSGVDSERLKATAAARRLDNVEFVPRVPSSQVGPYLRHAGALLVHLKADPLFEITIPAKTQTYLAMGRPILMAAAGSAAALVRAAGAGSEAQPENPQSIAAAAKRLAHLSVDELAAMGRAGQAHYAANLSVAAGVGRIADSLEHAMAAAGRR